MVTWIRRIYGRSATTLWDARHSLGLAGLIFATGCLLGAVFQEDLGFLQAQVEALLQKFSNQTAPAFIGKIFLHNLLAAYIGMCLLTLFGLVPAAVGLLIGWFAASFMPQHGPEIILMLLPHGLFEIPAVIIAWGIGIWRGAGYRLTSSSPSALERWQQANLVFMSMVLPLLLLAAVVEGRYHIARALFG